MIPGRRSSTSPPVHGPSERRRPVMGGRRGFLRAGLAGAALAASSRLAAALPLPDAPTSIAARDTHPVSLPQNDPHPVVRRLRVALEQRLYQYEYGYIASVAMLRQVPINQQFPPDFLDVLGSRVLDLVRNLIAQSADHPASSSLRAGGD